jgi:hypothetical protein
MDAITQNAKRNGQKIFSFLKIKIFFSIIIKSGLSDLFSKKSTLALKKKDFGVRKKDFRFKLI